MLAVSAPPAVAQQPGTPFDCSLSTIFVAQGALNQGTQLSALTYGASGSTFTDVGSRSSRNYNAIGYNPTDNFIYGVRDDGALLQVDSAGGIANLGLLGREGHNVGAFDENGTFYVQNAQWHTLYKLVPPSTSTTPIALDAAPNAADLSFVDGLLWGQQFNTSSLVRVDPVTGEVRRFATSFIPSSVAAGAAWTYGNGDLGISDNNSGDIYRIAISGASTDSPTFKLVSKQRGPASSGNDGAACLSPPADLSIVKSGPDPVIVGSDASWTLSVHNAGPGISSGFVVSDTLPAGFTNVDSPTPGCEVEGNTVTCGHGRLDPGADAVFEITATASSESDEPNTASVTGNEKDPNPDNDKSTVPARIVAVPADLSIRKEGTASPMFVGQSAGWTLTVRNNGPGASSGFTVSDTVPAGFTHVASSTPGCEVDGNAVTCTHGRLDAGGEAAFEITALASAPSDEGNSASVAGREIDPTPDNNISTTAARIVPLVGLCRGTPIMVLGLYPATANLAEIPCKSESRSVLRIYQGNLMNATASVTGSIVNGDSVATPRSAHGRADIAEAKVAVPGITLLAKGVHSEAHSEIRSSCSDFAVAGSSRLATLVVNGQTHVVGDQPMTIPLVVGNIYINQQIVSGSTITQRAIYVDLPGTLLDVAVGESRAGMACAAGRNP